MRRLTLGILVVVALAGAAVADRFRPPTPPLPAADDSDAPGGVWACPLVKMANTGGWLHLVNTGRDRALVRISFLPDGRRPVEQALTLQPQRAASVATPNAIAKFGAGAIVEYAGGDVTVSRSVVLSAQGASGVGAAACARPGTAGLVIPQGASLRAETQIALLNPGTADALVDIALLIGGEKIEPESLQHRIVPARGRLVVREGDFAFDEPVIAAQIVARSGRVVGDGLLLGSRVFEISPAQTAASELVAVASTARGATQFSAVAVGDEDAVMTGVFLSTTGQTTYEPLTNGLVPNTPRLDVAPGADVPPGPIALAASSSTAPFAIGARWVVEASSGPLETAASAGVQPARRAVVVLGPPSPTVGMRLLLANPDDEDATVEMTLITGAGPARPPALQAFRVPAGRAAAVSFPGLPRSATLGIALRSRGGRVAAVLEGTAALPGVFSAFAVTAIPVATVPEVAVEPDPVQGVPVQ